MEESSIVESEIHMNSLRRDLDSIASLQADLLEMDEDSGHSGKLLFFFFFCKIS